VRGDCDAGAFDTGGTVTNPFTVAGALNYLGAGGWRLGIAGSTDASFPVGYITFQKGGSSLVVRRPVAVTCLNQCVGVTGDLIPNAVVSLTLSGVVASAQGSSYKVGQAVSVVLTLTTTGRPNIQVAISAVTVVVNGVQVATAAAPFNVQSAVHFLLS
jgi:hypothetical protein